MRRYNTKRRPRKLATSVQDNWLRGLNLLTSQTEIRANELSDATDIMLVENGKIQCPRRGQSYYGSSSGTKVTGIFPFYKSDGTNRLVRMSGTNLQYLNGSTWTNIPGATYTADLDTEAITAYDRLYIVNGTDVLSYYDGTSITAFTEISAPNAPTVTRTGSSGSYTFSYKITAVTATGETTGSAAGSTTLNQSTLDSTNYMSISWSAVTNAIGYNLYGRKNNKWYFMTYLEGNGSTSYVDKGALTPQELFAPPEANSTGGPRGSDIDVYKDTLFIFGDLNNPSRLYYSAGGDLINDFSVSNGGGFIDISKNDGQKGIGLQPYKNVLLCFKEGSVYQFAFNDSLPSITQITSAVGCASRRSIVAVENDVFFYAGERGVYSIGNREGFAFDVLRSDEISGKIRPIIQSIEPTRINKVSAIYSTVENHNLVIFCYTPLGGTTNSRAVIYDRERYAWYEWTNITANCFTMYKDSTNKMHTLYGDDSSGYVKEILSGDDDFGSAINGSFALQAVSFGEPSVYKKLKKVDLIFREPTGYIQLSVVKDGVTDELTVPIATISPTVNWGHYLIGAFLFGESYGGEGLSTQDENVLRTAKNMNIEGRYFTLKFANLSGSFVLLYSGLSAKYRSANHRKAGELIEY